MNVFSTIVVPVVRMSIGARLAPRARIGETTAVPLTGVDVVLIVRLALLLVSTVGANRTVMVQVVDGATVVPEQVSALIVIATRVPPRAAVPSVSGIALSLRTLKVWVATSPDCPIEIEQQRIREAHRP